jgi:hypothetical protein
MSRAFSGPFGLDVLWGFSVFRHHCVDHASARDGSCAVDGLCNLRSDSFSMPRDVQAGRPNACDGYKISFGVSFNQATNASQSIGTRAVARPSTQAKKSMTKEFFLATLYISLLECRSTLLQEVCCRGRLQIARVQFLRRLLCLSDFADRAMHCAHSKPERSGNPGAVLKVVEMQIGSRLNPKLAPIALSRTAKETSSGTARR